ncbi:MAG: hypothetical protein U9R42_12100 [Bacteroidota bacterium]|nr:hypothetical protein [Bacteroidota bacterium]
MKITFLILISTLILFSSKAQIVTASASDLEELTKRKLIVIAEDYSHDIDKLTKKIEKANSEKKKQKHKNQLEKYESFVSSINTTLKKVIEDEWKLNESIEFMTYAEASKVIKGSKSQYSILQFDWYQQRDFKTKEFTHELPTFFYFGADGTMKYKSYSFYIPSIDNIWNDFTYEELLVSIKLMQLNIKESINNDLKKYRFGKFTDKKHKYNCSKLNNYTLYIDNSLVPKRNDYSVIKQKYDYKLAFKETKELNEIILNPTEGNALLILVPFKGGVNPAYTDPFTTKIRPDHLYYQLVIDLNTYEPLAKTYGVFLGERKRISSSTIKRLNNCKMK